MASKCGYFLHGWILPNYNLVLNLLILGKSMRTDYLIYIRGKVEVADLRAGVYASNFSSREGVPKLDTSISCASSAH